MIFEVEREIPMGSPVFICAERRGGRREDVPFGNVIGRFAA